MPPKIKEHRFVQRKESVDNLISIYKGLDSDQITDELNELTNMLYALLVSTECLSFEVMFGRDIHLFIELRESNQDVH